AVTRRGERVRLPDRPDGEPPSWLFESLDYPASNRPWEAYYAEFPVADRPSPPHRHQGAELVYVLKGRLVVSLDGEEVALDAGDAVHFDPATPHSYRRQGRGACAAIVVATPSTAAPAGDRGTDSA